MVPKTRLTLIVSIVLALFVSVLVCTTAVSRASAPVEIKFWHAMSRSRGEVVQNLVDKFNKQNPGIIVKAEFIQSKNRQYGNDYNALYSQILENLAKNTPPDVAQVYENWTTQYVDIDAIVPVEDFMSEEDKAGTKDLVPAFREANVFPSPSGRKLLYTLPFNKSIYVLYYNKDVFNRLGLKPPANWQELRKAAKAVSEKAGITGLAFQPSVDIFGHYLYSNGGKFINKDNKAAFGGDLGVKDLNYWVSLVHADRSAEPTFDAMGMFRDGKAGMYIETTSRIGGFEKARANGLNFGVLPIPAGTTQAYQFAGTNLAIFRGSNDKAKQEAAYKFVKFMSSPEATIYLSTRTGYLPVRQSAINSAEYKSYIKQHPDYGVGLNSLAKATVQPRVPVWESIRSILDDTMFKALGRKYDSSTAIDEAVDTADRLLDSVGTAQAQ